MRMRAFLFFHFVFLSKVAAKHFYSNWPPILCLPPITLCLVTSSYKISKFIKKTTEKLSFWSPKKRCDLKKSEGGDDQLLFFWQLLRSTELLIGAVLRPSHTAAITKTISITTQRERILLVEMLHSEYAHAHSTNHSRCRLFSRSVWPGLYSYLDNSAT